MKRTVLLLILTLVTIGGFCLPVSAAESDLAASVYVTISDGSGALALAQESIAVSDIDGDGKLTVNDALYCAHEAKFNSGADGGYASVESDWGLSLQKLWGIENGGSYGYYVNNATVMDLSAEIKSGDYINAFVYSDLTAWSDQYCYFNVNAAAANVGDEFTLTLTAASYDADYNPISVPVIGAAITINGTTTEYITDENGSVTIKLENAGTFTISAVSESETLVPPIAVLSAADQTTVATGDSTNVLLLITLAAFALCGAVATVRTKRDEI